MCLFVFLASPISVLFGPFTPDVMSIEAAVLSFVTLSFSSSGHPSPRPGNLLLVVPSCCDSGVNALAYFELNQPPELTCSYSMQQSFVAFRCLDPLPHGSSHRAPPCTYKAWQTKESAATLVSSRWRLVATGPPRFENTLPL